MEKDKKKKKRGPVAKVLIVIGIVVAVIVAVVLAYAAYLFLSYSRIDDNQVLEVKGKAENEVIAVGEELSMTSYNIGFGAYSDDYTFFMDGGKESWAFSEDAVYKNIAGAMDTITAYDPDIALFQEVDLDSTRSYHINETELVANAMEKPGQYSYTFAQNWDSAFLMLPPTQPHGASKAGIMSFSDAQITQAARRSLPVEEGFSKIIDLDRCYSKSRVSTDNGKELVLYNLHLSAYTAKAETAEIQLSMVIKDMQEEYDKGNYCVAGGDFNRDLLGNSPEIFHTALLDDKWAKPVNMSLFTDDITLVVPFDEANPAPSCRNPNKPYEKGDFVVTVDGFIKSANVDVTYANVIDVGFRYSDHNPVMMKLILKK